MAEGRSISQGGQWTWPGMIGCFSPTAQQIGKVGLGSVGTIDSFKQQNRSIDRLDKVIKCLGRLGQRYKY